MNLRIKIPTEAKSIRFSENKNGMSLSFLNEYDEIISNTPVNLMEGEMEKLQEPCVKCNNYRNGRCYLMKESPSPLLYGGATQMKADEGCFNLDFDKDEDDV